MWSANWRLIVTTWLFGVEDIEQRQIRIEGPHGAAENLDLSHRIACRADHDIHLVLASRFLPVERVAAEISLLTERGLADVRYNPDHSHPGTVGVGFTPFHPFADRVFIGPVLPGEGPADDNGTLGVRDLVLPCKIPALKKRYPNRIEVILLYVLDEREGRS